MKKFNLLVGALSLFTIVGAATGCSKKSDPKTITVCASELPHADVLNNCVKGILEEQGYTLKVKVLDWSIQNSRVASKDYDANYFQHVPYLNTFEGKGKKELVATAKVHYEPLGIYRGKASADVSLKDGKTFEICNDTSNAIRALQLLKAKEVITGELPISTDSEGNEILTFNQSWTSENGVKITLIAEELLASSRTSYDFACLPCNTAYTANVSRELQVAKEDDPAQVSLKANVLAVRKYDYLNNVEYKTKIDVLTDALLSDKVSQYFATAYNGVMTCDASSQIDLRSEIK